MGISIKTKRISIALLSVLVLGLFFIPFITNAQAAAGIEEGTQSPDSCPWNDVFCGMTKAMTVLYRGFLAGILGLASLATWAAGSLLDFVIKVTILDMSSSVNSIAGIGAAWATMRDVANVFFIFILLYAAVGTVLQLGVDTKRIITRVIVIALLVNFSLFFTKVIIDISNTVSLTFYNAITEDVPINPFSNEPSISGAYMDRLLVTTLYKTKDDGTSVPAVDLARYPSVAILGALFFLVTAFVFLAAAVLFIVRYVMLIFVMILSAPAFAAMALPNDSYSKKWWNMLFSQAIFAPIFFILAWITLQVLEGVLGVLNSGTSLATALAGSINSVGKQTAAPGAAAVYANFGIAITFMIASLAIAKSIAGSAGKGLQKFVGGAVGAATVGAVGWAGRRFIGGAAQRTLEDPELNRKALAGDPGARLQLRVAGGLAKSTFDARNTQAGKTFVGDSLGKGGGKGGFAKYEKDTAKKTAGLAKEANKPRIQDVYKAEQTLEERKTTAAQLEPVKSMESLIAIRKADAEAANNKIKAQYEKGSAPDATPEQTAQSEKLRKEAETELAKAQSELKRAQDMQNKLIAKEVAPAQERVDELKGVSKKEAEKRGIATRESLASRETKEAVESIGKRIFSPTRFADLSAARKAIEKKDKGLKAIEDYVKELDEEKEGGEKKEKEEKKEE